MTLPGISVNRRYPSLPSFSITGPSVKPKPPLTSSTLASGDTSASSAGSSRTTALSLAGWAAANELASKPALAITQNLVMVSPGHQSEAAGDGGPARSYGQKRHG